MSLRSFRMALAPVLGAIAISVNPAAAGDDVTAQLIETYKRSMLSWNIDYDALEPNRAGAACIPWKSLDETYLKEGIFEALGYAWQVAGEPYASRAAMEGCERMRQGLKLGDSCTCQLLLFNDELRLVLPETGE